MGIYSYIPDAIVPENVSESDKTFTKMLFLFRCDQFCLSITGKIIPEHEDLLSFSLHYICVTTHPQSTLLSFHLQGYHKVTRTVNPKLKTQVRLGRKDLIMLVMEKDEKKLNEVNVDYFGHLPNFDFNNMEMSPGSPEGRPKGSSSSFSSSSESSS